MSFTDQPSSTNQEPNSTNQGPGSFGTDQPTNVTPSENADKAFLIVGDRAFRDRDALVKHISSAQAHIQTLEAERAADRQTLAELKAEVERLKKIADAAASAPAKDDPPFDPDEVVSRTVAVLSQQEQAKVQAANLAAAIERAKKAYGDEFTQKVNEKAAALGMTLEEVDLMAKTKPALFDATFLPPSSTRPNAYQPGHDRSTGKPSSDTSEERRNVLKMSEKERIAYVASLINQS